MNHHQTMFEVLSLLILGAVLFGIDFQSIAGAIALTTTAETLAAVGFAISLPSGNGKAVVKCYLALTAGTSTTTVVIKVYRGFSTAGTLIGTFPNTIPAAAGNPPLTFSCAVSDVLQSATQAQYCFSVTQTAATGNGSITAASIETELLSG